MKVRIKSLSAFQTGKVLALFYCFGSALFVIVFFVIILSGSTEKAWPMLLMAVLYPVFAFVGGFVGAIIYNFVAQVTGGFEIEMETDSPESRS